MNKGKIKTEKRDRRRARIRSKVSGTKDMPRLSVFKSNKYLYAQLIDDDAGNTLVSSSSILVKGKGLEQARTLGKEIAKAAAEKKISKAVFDRGGFIYTGKVQALAEGAREGGLQF